MISRVLKQRQHPREAINDAWKILLLNQFHDILPGSSIAEVNPSVVAAAAQRLESRAGPLICTAGQAASAAQLLLSSLQQMGCQVLYHGDFDPSGIVIANLMVKRFRARPVHDGWSGRLFFACQEVGLRVSLSPSAPAQPRFGRRL